MCFVAKMRSLLLACLALEIIISLYTVEASKRSDLRRDLFANYDKLVKPDEAVTVNFSINVLGLSYCPHKEVV